MTRAEALARLRRATIENTKPDGDLITFGGWNLDDVILALRATRSVRGEGVVFVADDLLTVIFSGEDMFVSGRHRP